MPVVHINYWAVLVAALADMAVGFIWYMPQVFGNAWMQEIGKKKEELGKPGPGYFLAFVGALVFAYVLAHFVDYVQADTISKGLQIGFWAWLGFIATSTAGMTIFEGRSLKLWLITNGHLLLGFLAAAAILARWQ